MAVAKGSKVTLESPGGPETWKLEMVDPSDLRVGDWFHLYGTEVARVKAVDAEKPSAGLVFEWNGREVTGLRPGKMDEKVARIHV